MKANSKYDYAFLIQRLDRHLMTPVRVVWERERAESEVKRLNELGVFRYNSIAIRVEKKG